MGHNTQAVLPKTDGWSAVAPWPLVIELAFCLTLAVALIAAMFLGLVAAIWDASQDGCCRA